MLSTVGYEGAALEDFILTLQRANVEVLVDVRERAQSRRRGFSKTALSHRLGKAGIAYVHYRELGDPKPGREAARAGDMKLFRRIYGAVIVGAPAKAAVGAIIQLTRTSHACLMCYEADASDCHRTLVAAKIERETGKPTTHLKVTVEQASKQPGRVRNSREGRASSQQQLL